MLHLCDIKQLAALRKPGWGFLGRLSVPAVMEWASGSALLEHSWDWDLSKAQSVSVGQEKSVGITGCSEETRTSQK